MMRVRILRLFVAGALVAGAAVAFGVMDTRQLMGALVAIFLLWLYASTI